MKILGSKISQKHRRWIWGYLFIIPVLLLFSVFRIYPLIRSFSLGFYQWNILSPIKPFVGLQNYRELFEDAVFVQGFKNTIIYTVTLIFVGTIIALFLALLLNRKFKLKGTFKLVYFLPVITPMVAAAVIWEWLYQPQFGLFNGILKYLGLPTQQWLMSKDQALMSVIIFSMWKGVGYNMIIFLAGLQGIPNIYYEAARIDGANSFQCFKGITLPLLMPTTLFVIVMSTISTLQVFTQIYVMTEGGPINATMVVVLHIYKVGFDFLRFGYASAIATVLFIFILAITVLQLKFLGKRAEVTY
jgi:multiple sugar transport system permease protein